jgi:phosphate transport system protein
MTDSPNLVQKKRTHLEHSVHDLGLLVIAALRKSVSCLQDQDLVLAEQIITDDSLINHRRRVLEQECLVTLAAFKPAAEDLRGIGSCLGVVAELERIGDYAADVARIVRRAGAETFPAEPVMAIVREADQAVAMLAAALVAFGSGSGAEGAREAVAGEPQVDLAEDAVVEQVLLMMRSDPSFATLGTYLLWIAHNYERVADRATNVAEYVIYISSGQAEQLD